jgi:capsular polysaccharide transport system permease protein
MTTNPKAKKFRLRRGASLGTTPEEAVRSKDAKASPGKAATRHSADARQAAPSPQPEGQAPKQTPSSDPASSAPEDLGPTDIEAIRREGLTGRQLRMARRVAQKQGLAVTSDFDAVRQLREAGVNPFQRNTILELVAPDGVAPATGAAVGRPVDPAQGRIQLPQTMPNRETLPSTDKSSSAVGRARDISAIQRDIAKRRRRRSALLLVRLACFVMIPTFIVGWYYSVMATPMYATNSEFVIQQAEPGSAAGGLGGLFQGTSMATQQDSITVQSYLASRAAMLRLDGDHDFIAHFSQDNIDPIQRLPEDATNEAAFGVYSDKVKISYDPTEGILRMEVIAADPETSETFSQALIRYAEEQVDQLTQRLREDQMASARDSYASAETRRAEALDTWLTIQQEAEIIDPIGETGALTSQISALEQQRQQLQLNLSERLNVRQPNEAQVNSLRGQIANIEALIADIRGRMTAAGGAGNSLATRNTELRLAEENYTFQTVMVQQALAAMEAAQIEANRQVRYLSLGVEPVGPDEATYPRAFENTILAFLIFAGVYLMISLTASILREQVTA